jgi:hypothetical protein
MPLKESLGDASVGKVREGLFGKIEWLRGPKGFYPTYLLRHKDARISRVFPVLQAFAPQSVWCGVHVNFKSDYSC